MNHEDDVSKNALTTMLYLLQLREKEDMAKMLSDLEQELRLSNRFFPNTKLTDIIRSLTPSSSLTIKKGTVLFRCRLITKEDEHKFLDPFIHCLQLLFENFIPSSTINSIEQKKLQLSIYLDKHPEEIPRLQKLLRQFTATHSISSFWGYDAAGSDAPPSNLASSGRINPDGISYLYTATDIQTAILEVRPIPTQYVSIAQIELLEDITLYSFTSTIELEEEAKNLLSIIKYEEISKYFSQPNYGGKSYYLATQYISEYIKHMKDSNGQPLFDGLCFRSSLNPNGKNYALFDVSSTKKYQICNSSLYQVSDLLGNATRLLPIEKVHNHQ